MYRDPNEELISIPDFLEKIYNERRLHSALGYVSPAEKYPNHVILQTNEIIAVYRR